MKRTYYTTAIVASLVLGSICSTTLAGNKHGSQAARSSNHGGSSNSSKPHVSMNSASRVRSQNLGNSGIQFQGGGQSFKKVGSLNNATVNSKLIVGKYPTIGVQKTPKFKISPSNPQLINPIVKPYPCKPPICNPPICSPCKPSNCSPCKPNCFPWPWPDCYPCDPCCKPIIITCPTYCEPYCQTVVYSQPAVTQVVVKEVEKRMQVPVGATLVLQAQSLGMNAGQVMLQVDKVGLGALVNEWKNESVNTTLPMLGIAGPTPAQIVIFKADGSMASSLNVELIPAQPQAAAAVATTAVQVTK